MIHNNEPRWPNDYASELRRPGSGGLPAKAKSIPGGRKRQVEKYSNSYHNISFLPDPMAVFNQSFYFSKFSGISFQSNPKTIVYIVVCSWDGKSLSNSVWGAFKNIIKIFDHTFFLNHQDSKI